MNTVFAIGIPTINRYDLLKPTIKKYLVNFPNTKILIVDNGNQGLILKDFINEDINCNLEIIHCINPLSVAASWNTIGKSFAKSIQNYFILNDDVVVDFKEQDVINFINRFPWHHLYKSQQGFCSFILPRSTWNIIGQFDENFKGAYFEDNDYEMRIKLAKGNILAHSFLNPAIYRESSSIKKDPLLNSNFNANAGYYFDKWGGGVGHEKYLTPFNK